MEDNVYFSHGVLAVSNAQLVERAARIVRELGREIATPEEARDLIILDQHRSDRHRPRARHNATMKTEDR
jgi:3-keto-5-aminohexanoate cleavage enzyme